MGKLALVFAAASLMGALIWYNGSADMFLMYAIGWGCGVWSSMEIFRGKKND